jgi:hypothetical protein
MYYKMSKVLSVTVLGRPYSCETLRLPHFEGNRLTDGGEVVSLKHRPPFAPRRILVLIRRFYLFYGITTLLVATTM